MPSTFTGSGLEKPGSGEQTNTWDDTLNLNFDIIDRLASQAGTISLTGTTHTLTISDGALSEGQYAVMVFAGSPSGTNTVTISPNTAERMFFARNASGQTVVLTQGSGGNVTVLNGEAAIVYCDGAGSGAAVVNIAAELPVTGLGTMATQNAASVDINGGAIDGVVIGGTTPAAGSFTTLGASSTATFGTVDINGGAIDGAVIGANSAAAGTFTTAVGTDTTKAFEALSATPAFQLTDSGGGICRITGNDGAMDLWADTGNTQSSSAIRFRVDGSIVARFDQNGHLRAGDSAAPTVTAEFAGTDAVLLPVGTEAQRPTGVKGYLRFNDDTDAPEYYDGAVWQDFGNDWTETAVSTATGGTAYDVTSIPSGVSEIQVFAIQVSLSGTDDFLLQLGTGGAPVTTGYSSTGTYATASNNIVGVNSTIGFLAQGFGAAANVDLIFTLFKVPGVNTWICKHQSQGGTFYAGYGAGSVTLSGTLDMVRLTRTVTTFDAMGAFFTRYR